MPDGDLGVYVAKLGADLHDLKSGLQLGRQDFQSFQGMIESGAAKVRQVLSFAGISLGLYALISQAKEFGKSILEEGGKVEVLRGAADSIANYYGMSAAAVDFYIQKLKEKNIEESRGLEAVNAFMRAGLDISQLPQLAGAAQDLGRSMGMSAQEAFTALVQGIIKQTPKQLAEMVPEVKQALKAMLSETGKDIDALIVSGPEKAQMMLDIVLKAWDKAKGAGDATMGSYQAQMEKYRAVVAQAKEALFEMMKPVSMAITGAEIKSWQDFYEWIIKNRVQLAELGEIIGIYIQKGVVGTKQIIDFAFAHKELLKVLFEIAAAMKVLSWFAITEGAAAATVAIGGTITTLMKLRLALTGPWALAIVVSLVGLNEVYKQFQKIQTQREQIGKDLEQANLKEQATKKLQAGEKLSEAEMAALVTPAQRAAVAAAPKISEADAVAQAQAASKMGKEEAALGPKPAKGGGKAGREEDLYGEYLKVRDQLRQARIQDAQTDLDLFKAANEQKKAENDKALAEGLIDGQTYYQRLQEMQQAETAKALALIAEKRQAQAQAYQDALSDIGRQDISPEMADYKRQEEAGKNRLILSQLDAETAKTRLEGEKKVTEELTRQVKLRQQYQDQTAALNIETEALLGQISGQEATLQKLTLDWQKAKRDAIAPGASPTDLAALEANMQAKKADTLYGGYATSITQGISGLLDTISQGGANLMQATNSMFKSLFAEALKPGLDQLKGMLVSGFKDLFGSAGAGLASAVMGAIGLVGMLLTSGGGKSSYSASSLTGGVTTHEVVQGIIAGPTSIPIAQISDSLADALVPTNGLLSQIEVNTRAGLGGLGIKINAEGLAGTVKAAIKDVLDQYFADVLIQGVT